MRLCHHRVRPRILILLFLLVIPLASGCNPLKIIGSSLTFNIYIPLSELSGGSEEQIPTGGTQNTGTIPIDPGVPNQPPVGGFPIEPPTGTVNP